MTDNYRKEVAMNMIDRKEKELKKLWQMANMAQGSFKDQLLNEFWREYRLLRKTKKFQRAIRERSDSHLKVDNCSERSHSVARLGATLKS